MMLFRQAAKHPLSASHRGSANGESRDLHPGQLAYLPVWDATGLPFLINADFLLVSSREELRENEAWNLWLRDCISEVFVEAFLSVLQSNKIPSTRGSIYTPPFPWKAMLSSYSPSGRYKKVERARVCSGCRKLCCSFQVEPEAQVRDSEKYLKRNPCRRYSNCSPIN